MKQNLNAAAERLFSAAGTQQMSRHRRPLLIPHKRTHCNNTHTQCAASSECDLSMKQNDPELLSHLQGSSSVRGQLFILVPTSHILQTALEQKLQGSCTPGSLTEMYSRSKTDRTKKPQCTVDQYKYINIKLIYNGSSDFT